MGLGHYAVGFSVKPLAPKVPLGIPLFATTPDVPALAFGWMRVEGAKTGIPWSHFLFTTVIWSMAADLL